VRIWGGSWREGRESGDEGHRVTIAGGGGGKWGGVLHGGDSTLYTWVGAHSALSLSDRTSKVPEATRSASNPAGSVDLGM
jgi:hypothetical protein